MMPSLSKCSAGSSLCAAATSAASSPPHAAATSTPHAAATSTPEQRIDGRRKNKGSVERRSYSNREKVMLVDEVYGAIEDGCLSATSYFQERGFNYFDVRRKANNFNKWKLDNVYGPALQEIVLGKDRGNAKKKKCNRNSPFQQLEVILYQKFQEMRRNDRKVSSNFLTVRAKQIFLELQASEPDKWGTKEFKASRGWLKRFMARKQIKFKKRKCGKEKTAQESIPEFLLHLAFVRFDLLQPRMGMLPAERQSILESVWGRFTPARRYNMDQVPLPFVVGQDHTFTQASDKDVNIKSPGEQFRKRQFTMHIVTNAGSGTEKQGWVDLVCRGKGMRIRQAERDLWDKDVDVFWQKNAWVDTVVMKKLADKFVRMKNELHGPDEWVLLFCDNLRAHVATEVKQIFGDNKVLLCFLPPGTTNFSQAIDAGYGRSLRIAVANSLDEWLMECDNMEKWEGKMTAGERRILTTTLVAAGNKKVMSDDNDEMRIGCFERTGNLITMNPLHEFDKKIKPQGMKEGSFEVPTDRSLLDGGEDGGEDGGGEDGGEDGGGVDGGEDGGGDGGGDGGDSDGDATLVGE